MIEQIEPTLNLPALLERSRRLDRYALEELHDLLYPLVYRYVCFRLASSKISQEITAQIFQNFLNTLTKRSHSRKQPLVWLIKLTDEYVNDSNTMKDKNYNADKEPKVNTKQAVNEEYSGENNDNIGTALRQLKPIHQHILALRFTTQASLEQTALLMDKPIRRVRSLQWQALQALYDRLESGKMK
jgi:DNA-directed RNA polymerase specialized sigma24 family protein